MKIAIVILNWNGKELLEKFLPSIVKYSNTPSTEIIIADNASTDSSISFIKKTYPEIQIIQNSENGGFAKGYNEALKHVNADILALVNSDIEVKTSKVKVGRRPPLTSTPATLLIQDDELDRLTVAELNVLLAERLHEYQTSYKQIVDKHSESYATAVRCTYDSYWAEKTADDYKETTKKEATSSETPNDDRGETNVAAHAKEHRTYVYRTGYCPYVAADGDDDEMNDSYDSSDSENSNKSNHIFNEYPEEKSRSDEEKDFNSDEHENDSEDEESSLMMKDMQCDMGYY